MLSIMGRSTYEERPLGVMRAGKAANSHDTIAWATTYARWCFRNKGNTAYTDNICDVYDVMAALNATRLNTTHVRNKIRPRMIAALVKRSGLLPPTESMLTLHEIVHVCDQVEEVGAPRVSSLYKFERMNLVLKQLLQNHAKGESFELPMSYYVKLCYITTTMLYYVILRQLCTKCHIMS